MLSESIKFCKGLAPAADRFNTDPVSDYVNTQGHKRVTFLVIHQGGTTGKATLTVLAATNASGGSAAAQAFTYRRMTTGDSDTNGAPAAATSAGIDTVPAEDTIIEIEVDVASLPDGKPFVALKCTEAVNDPVTGAVLIILDGARYQGLTPPTAIA